MIGKAIVCDYCGKTEFEKPATLGTITDNLKSGKYQLQQVNTTGTQITSWPAEFIEPGIDWLVVTIKGTNKALHFCINECLVAYYKERSKI